MLTYIEVNDMKHISRLLKFLRDQKIVSSTLIPLHRIIKISLISDIFANDIKIRIKETEKESLKWTSFIRQF